MESDVDSYDEQHKVIDTGQGIVGCHVLWCINLVAIE